jgi:hypothetical protein
MRRLTDEPGYPTPHDPAAVERASEDDRLWVKDHPGENVRLRPEVPGELPSLLPPGPGRIVEVLQVMPGSRLRRRTMIFLLDEGRQG